MGKKVLTDKSSQGFVKMDMKLALFFIYKGSAFFNTKTPFYENHWNRKM